MKKALSMLMAFALAISLAACGQSSAPSKTSGGGSSSQAETSGQTSAAKDVLVGVAMPTKSLQRWNQDGANLEAGLTEKGYKVDLQYAENKVEAQVSQIENMITKGATILVIAPVDGGALTSILERAKSEGISVIAYDRFITDTTAVDVCATFDNTRVGEIQGQYIIDKLGLTTNKGPFNLEITAGPLDDNNASYFLNGALNVLQPYIDNGTLVVRSGQKTREQCATPNWEEKEAQARMDNILTAYYSDDEIDAVLCSNDSTSLGVQSSLKSVGYGTAEKPMPVITGQDANIANVKAIIKGEQTMSVFKDTRSLAKQVVKMVEAYANGEEPPINDTTTYNNGAKVVPAYKLDPIAVDKDNYKELLVDSGYYTEDQLQ